MAAPGPPVAGVVHRRAFVDFQNDVTTKDLSVAADEGFVAIEHVKRYTTTGMATDQGKTSGVNTAAAMAVLTGQDIGAVGVTSFRPPYTPVTFGALAGASRGALYAPVRLPPVAAEGAVTEDVGTWRRARCFPVANETTAAAVVRECAAVRGDVGIFDASTLGKIEVVGRDAGVFLSRMYTGDFSALAPGRCRYAVLLGEDGFIRDDGIVARLAADRFHVTTTTGGAAFVLHHMEDYLQTDFPDLRVWLTSVTEQWAVIAVQGPQAAALLAPFIAGIDLGSMAHMSVREGHIGDVPMRLFRVSFTGEPGFEINVPPSEAQRVWDTLRACGATRYGTDAMHLLRAEKGFVSVGQETDGTVTPGDVGLGWTIRGGDFVGRRSLSLPDLIRADRRQLVGLLPEDPAVVLEEGAQVTAAAEGRDSIGYVTSAYRSAALGRGFALGMVEGGRGRMGAAVFVPMPRGAIRVTVTDPVFVDKAGERVRAKPVERKTEAVLLDPVVPPVPVARPSSVVQMAVLAPTTRLSVRAGPAAATAIGLALGVLLPTVPCRSMISRDRAALWLGPDEWLIVAPEAASDLAVQAMRAVGEHPVSVVDVSHRSQTLELTGARAAWCLNAFCALDLGTAAFPVGMCTRTIFGQGGDRVVADCA